MTTNVQWLDAIQALRPTGVTRFYAQQPRSLTTSDLPAAWPMLPSVSRGEPLATCGDGEKVRTLGYMVAINPINQDIPSENPEAAAPIVDALETAFETLESTMIFIEYEIATSAEIAVAGTAYWGLECTVTGRNA
jgi:hypothetical protein